MLNKPRRRKSPVTIIIGLKTKGGIVIACDSRTTEPSGYIRDDTKKLRIIAFEDGNEAIVAMAGNDAFASRAIEIIEHKAKSLKLTNNRSFADCAENAVQELRNSVRKQNEGATP